MHQYALMYAVDHRDAAAAAAAAEIANCRRTRALTHTLVGVSIAQEENVVFLTAVDSC